MTHELNASTSETLKRVQNHCSRLSSFAFYARNNSAFELMEDLRDAACMHIFWLDGELRSLPSECQEAFNPKDLQRVMENVEQIKIGVAKVDWSALFFTCASVSSSIHETAEELASKSNNTDK